MNDHDRLISYIEDKIRQSEEQYRLTSTDFLSESERAEAELFCRRGRTRYAFYGGYPEAERSVLLLLPDYMEPETPFSLFMDSPEENPLALLRCRTPASGTVRTLTHRDYLGSLLSLGIKRELIGDILVSDDGADILVVRRILPFLLANYEKAGSVPLSCENLPMDALRIPAVRTKEIRESVASLRLDNLLCAAFSVSRTEAAAAIGRGLVSVNGIEASKPDARLEPGDRLVLRGAGKAVFRMTDGTTRKGRFAVIFDRFI